MQSTLQCCPIYIRILNNVRVSARNAIMAPLSSTTVACIDCGGLYSPTTDYWMCVARIDDYGGNALYSDVG